MKPVWPLLATIALGSSACAHPYLAANFATVYQPRTHVVAVAPLANLTTEPEAAQAGAAIREAIYFELSRHQEQYSVTIQDIAQTDKLLHDAGYTDSAGARLPGPDLARILHVDAVMRGSVTRFHKSGAGGQVVTALLFGFAKGSEVKADVAIYDGSDGQLIWQHNINKAGGFLSSPDALRNKVGGVVAKKFPYKRAA
ncbi:MAG TPA: hypothetical protein VGJ80_05225 [Gemmatimonadales bacterium]|jgi:TolB-like protein